MLRVLPLMVCFAAVLVSGLLHGLWTFRWQPSRALEEAVQRVPEVPLVIGDWHGEELPTDPAVYAQAGAQGYWMRRYRHQATKEIVSVILMCGPGGRMSVHTPDICYQGAGFQMIGSQKAVTIPLKDTAHTAEFWTGHFAKGTTTGAGQLHLYWAWSFAGDWQAPEHPRFTFRGQPVLYKLYVINSWVPRQGSQEQAPGVTFLQQLVPVLQKTLFTPTPP
jgi:Protein of unknown function (DUF3485)